MRVFCSHCFQPLEVTVEKGIITMRGATPWAFRSRQVVAATTGIFCPECGTELWEQEGCLNCSGCGWSKC